MINARKSARICATSSEEMQAKHPLIGDVRGMGLLRGVELVEDRENEDSRGGRRPTAVWKPRARTG